LNTRHWYLERRYARRHCLSWVPRGLPMIQRAKVEPPTPGQGPAGATRKRALPAEPPAETSDEKKLSAKQAHL
jgi:hypothetical protein